MTHTIDHLTAPGIDEDLRSMMRSVLTGDLTDRLTQPTDGVRLDRALWDQLAELGLVGLTLPEADGGSGATWLESAALLSESAGQAHNLPLAETDLLALWLLRQAGAEIDSPELPRTVAVVDATGHAASVPWLDAAERVVLAVARPDGATYRVSDLSAAEFAALADVTALQTNSGQQRSSVHLNAAAPTDAPTGAPVEASVLDLFNLRGALVRAVQCVGAMDRAIDLAIEHTSVRTQFGRALAQFQAVQQLVADAAARAALARSATEAAVLEAWQNDLTSPEAAIKVAVARSCVGHAASVVVRATHQVHGAIGTTQEHPLQLFTLPVLDWRSEFGTTASYDRWLGTYVANHPEEYWQVVVGQGVAR